MITTMDLSVARRYIRETLVSDRSADESDYLLSHVLNKERAWLYAHSEYRLNETESTRLRQLVEKRKSGTPWAYLKGYKEFYGLQFSVSDAVLIPRPETEIAVELAINLMPANGCLLDLGTGSGNIAIAIAYHRPDLNIVAADISTDALDAARSNAKRHHRKITFVHSDWYRNIDVNTYRFDWIISNPPYIAYNDSEIDRQATDAEPELALYAEDNGIAELKTVIEGARKYLNSNGTLLVEHGYAQAEAVSQLMQSIGFAHTCCLRDTALYQRYTVACYANLV